MELPGRLADMLAQHLAATGKVNQSMALGASRHQGGSLASRVLLPADQQRACVPPRIAAPATPSGVTAQPGSN